jgi:hypothetical protein
MYGRSASFALLLLLLGSTQAHARKTNLAAGTFFGLGFIAGAERRPQSNFTTGSPVTSSAYSKYILFLPYFDFLNFVIQPYAGWHVYGDQNGKGIDSRGSFAESSHAGNFSYGARLLLVPFLSRDLESRAYLALGMGNVIAKIKNVRSYQNAAGNTYTEWVKGTGLELHAGAGYEVMFLQNYSLQLEGGYAERHVHQFKYSSTNDVSGATRAEGEVVKNTDGNQKAIHVWSPYLQVGLNLNF